MVQLTDVVGRRLFDQAVSGGAAAAAAGGRAKNKGKAGESFPTLSGEDALALRRSRREKGRKRTLERL